MMLVTYLIYLAARKVRSPGVIILLAFAIVLGLSLAGSYGYIQRDDLGIYAFCVIVAAFAVMALIVRYHRNPEA